MKKKLLLFSVYNLILFTANSQNRINEIAISQQLVFNRTKIYDIFAEARASYKTGNAFSNGTSIKYNRGITNKIYATVSLGYFNQRFGITRPFKFFEPVTQTKMLYHTKRYNYKTYDYSAGVGFRQPIKASKKILDKAQLNFAMEYVTYNTFQQKFVHILAPSLGNPNIQIRTLNYYYGNSLLIKSGIVKPVLKKINIGIDLVFPVYNKWSKDEIFNENFNQYHGAVFSTGLEFNFMYSLKANRN